MCSISASCYREKGLFDLVEAVAEVNARLQAKGLAKRVQLDVAGKFYLPEEEVEFIKRIGQADLNDGEGPLVVFHGFADEVKKLELLGQADAFRFRRTTVLRHIRFALWRRWRTGCRSLPRDGGFYRSCFRKGTRVWWISSHPIKSADRLEGFIGRTDEPGYANATCSTLRGGCSGEKVRTALLSLEKE